MGIQLSLTPRRGFGLLMWGELLTLDDGEPFFATTKRNAQRAFAEATPSYLRLETFVVEVEIHEPGPDGLPTYVIGNIIG